MKIGIMGGTFNPPHIGHISAACAAATGLALDKVLFVPDSMPPHKEIPDGAPSAQERYEMASIAAKEAGAEVSNIELVRGGKSYTVDTIKELFTMYPDCEFWLIVGTDMFLSIEEWRNPEKIFSSVNLAVIPRYCGDTEALSEHADKLFDKYGAVSRIIEADAIPISSSDIRRGIALGKCIEYLPTKVYEYIVQKGLYGVQEADAT